MRQLDRGLVGWCAGVFSRVFGEITPTQFHDLFLTQSHSPLVSRRRAFLIISRVRMVAAVFGFLTPLWIAVDALLFPWPLWGVLAGLRAGASICFLAIAFLFRPNDSIHHAQRALGALLAVPTIFFLISQPALNGYHIVGAAQAVASSYAFLPFVMAAGLSVFPITACEGLLFAAPLMAATGSMIVFGIGFLPFTSYLGTLWLLGLIAAVATLAGMSQLHFMMALVTQASHDGLTRAYTRRVGEELLEIQFINALRQNIPLALAFIDLDKFKSVNDQFGHEEGDNILRKAADVLRAALRRSDVLVRWGGEEFLVVMPGTDANGARIVVSRLRASGFGLRPDGISQTASIGVSERIADGIDDWQVLVEAADRRMYAGKKAGRNRAVLPREEMLAEEMLAEEVMA